VSIPFSGESGSIEFEPLQIQPNMNSTEQFDALVCEHYQPLFRFAMSLTRSECDACDLTQQTFYLWATKGHQLRDISKVKSWLFTALHRVFLVGRRKQSRFSHHQLEEVSEQLPTFSPKVGDGLDSGEALAALGRVDEIYQAPVALFYLEDCSYKEIAEILEVPIGTVKSRIARGIAQLRETFSDSRVDEQHCAERDFSPVLMSGTPRTLCAGKDDAAWTRCFRRKPETVLCSN